METGVKRTRHCLEEEGTRNHKRQARSRVYLEKDEGGKNVLKFGIRAGRQPVTPEVEAVAVEPKEKVCCEQARSYQLEVLQQAQLSNTIAFLETGAGKTLIAVLLMQSKAEELKASRKMLAVFLVPKVPLVYQQAEVIRERTNFRVGHYCGEMGQDFWDERKWHREFESKEVLVMTAQILLNILRHSIIKMDGIDLLILDECHHAVKKHPYSLVMSEFYHLTSKDKRPTIFGMTASPVNLKGVSNQEACALKIRNLESKLDSIVCTIRDRKELEKHVPMPCETIVEYDKASVLWSIREQINGMEKTLEAAAIPLKRNKWQLMTARDRMKLEQHMFGVSEKTESDGAANLLQKLRAISYSLDELGQWCAYQVASSMLASVVNDERASHEADVKFQESYLTKVNELLKCELTEGAAVDIPVDNNMEIEEGEVCETNGGTHVDPILGAAVASGKVTPKVQCLVDTLLKYECTDDFRAIIFVDRVVAALVLPKLFACLHSLRFIKSASLIGHSNNQDMGSRQMQDTLSQFRDGRVTLLVATSVAEEGLDIRQCNVVIRFDLAKTVLAYIQSRGRARKPGSDYISMLERNNASHQSFLRNSRNSEETLRREAIERTKLGSAKEALLSNLHEGVEGAVYQVPSTGATVTLNSAVGLIHFYCSQLPSDRYSILKPEFVLNEVQIEESLQYSCRLQFPSNAPLEFVDGPNCASVKAAQQAVCLEACRKLHELGAFTNMLLPDKGCGEPVKDDKEEGEPLPGTARHREFYPEGVADVLKGDWITIREGSGVTSLPLYVYQIKCVNNAPLKDPHLTEASEFAVLFGRQLDSEILATSMNLFITRTLTTEQSLVFTGIREFSLEEVQSLKAFHVRLMSVVLDVDVDPVSTSWNAAKAYLFVPLIRSETGIDIDWSLIQRLLNTSIWENPLHRARPDVRLGTDGRALGGDRKEFRFRKLTGEQQKHPTYGIRGAVAAFDVRKVLGISFPETSQVLQEGQLQLADGIVAAKDIVGKIVTAAHSGKRFYVQMVCPEITSESLFPRKEGYLGPLEYDTYGDYYKQKYGVELAFKKQPMLRGRGVSHCKNLLSPRFEKLEAGSLEDKVYYVMLPAEICSIHPFCGSLVRGAQRLPSIMRRVESMLLAIQLKQEINYPVLASKVLEALTAASCQETFSYERAELLGDAYLKWVVSRRLFLKFPGKHEGQLTRMRQQIVSNSVLYEYALQRTLQTYIQADRFAPSRWAAPGVPPVFDEDIKDSEEDSEESSEVSSEGDIPVTGTEIDELRPGTPETPEVEVTDDSAALEEGEIEPDSGSYRVLSSKTLADVVEALIGVYCVEGGQKAAQHMMNWIGIPTDYDVSDAERARANCTVPESVMKSIHFDDLETALGYRFEVRSLLVEAITHASRPCSGVPCYQRMEFIGDAVLDHLITRHLYFTYDNLPPGRLTDLRAAAVNNENFARVSVKNTFHLHLRHGSSALESQIRDFVKDIQAELDKPGVNSFGIGDFKAPKVLGDILESIAGAVFLDTGLDADRVWKVVEPLLQPLVTPETLPVHPVRELQELCQQQAEGLEYKASRTGNVAKVEVFVDGIQIGCGQNSQKKMAQKLAARNALVVLKDKKDNSSNDDKSSSSKPVFTRQSLNDICLRRQWPMPQYRLLSESGPAHAKRFTYTVRVNAMDGGWSDDCEGQPMPSVKKAKDSAALVLLELLKQWPSP